MADEESVKRDGGTPAPIAPITPMESVYIRLGASLIFPFAVWVADRMGVFHALGVDPHSASVESFKDLVLGVYVLVVGGLVIRKRVSQGNDPTSSAPPIAAPAIVQRLTK